MNVPGSRECYFLVKDLSSIRIPPTKFPKLYNENTEVIDDFNDKILKFYANYDCISEIEDKTLINFLMDKEVYALLQIMRYNDVSVSNCLEILGNKEDLFNELLNKKIIYEARGIVSLFSDIRFLKFTPYYIINTLSKRYKSQEISLNQYLTHIKLLTTQYENQPSILNYEII
jgi:hypothetical protein